MRLISQQPIKNDTLIPFDYPLNERMRIFLRLESLLLRLNAFIKYPSHLGVQTAMDNLIDILHIFTCRVDLKAELIKELERHQALLQKLQNNPNADSKRLGALQHAIRPLLTALYASETTPGHPLKNNNFIKSIIQRSGIPGGTCSFDLPNYHMWLNQSLQAQQQDLISWCDNFALVRDSILLILKITRNSVLAYEKIAQKGFLQLNLDKTRPYQMLHVQIQSTLGVYPEISGNKHRCVIRFMQFSTAERPAQTKDDINFLLTCCQI